MNGSRTTISHGHLCHAGGCQLIALGLLNPFLHTFLSVHAQANPQTHILGVQVGSHCGTAYLQTETALVFV